MESKLKEIIADISREELSSVHDNDLLVNDLGFESIDFADLLNQTELLYDIELPEISPTITYKEMKVSDFVELVNTINNSKHE